MKVVPLGANVVVRRSEAEPATTGGILLPDNAREKPRQGRVLSVGDGRVYAGTELTVNNEPLLIMSEDEILAIMD
jgi:chaperonin GroES